MNDFSQTTAETPEQKAKRLGVPLIPKCPTTPPPGNPHGVVSVCGECGLEIYRTMGYSCQRNNCPTGLGSR